LNQTNSSFPFVFQSKRSKINCWNSLDMEARSGGQDLAWADLTGRALRHAKQQILLTRFRRLLRCFDLFPHSYPDRDFRQD
jgi:hypothetical protein